MAMQGLGKNQELDSSALLRDARPLGRRIAETLAKSQVTATVIASLGVAGAIAPAVWEPCALSGVGLYFWYRNYITTRWTMPFRMPKSLNRKDPGELAAGDKKPVMAGGICYLGNERRNFPGSNGEQIWATDSDMRTHMLVFGTTGAGKAQPLDALVHTPLGWKRMGDLKHGDMVSTPSGGVARIDGVFPQGVIPVFKVTFEDGRSTEACGNHLWQIQFKPEVNTVSRTKGAPVGKAMPKTMNTNDLIKRIAAEAGRFTVPLVIPVNRPKANLAFDPYALGYLLGDVEFSARQMSFISEDADVVRRIKAAMPEGVEVIPVRSQKGRYWLKHGPSKDTPQLHPLRTVLTLLGLSKAGAREKAVPAVYFDASVEQRRALLQGLMDANGGVIPKRGVTFISPSERLAKDVQSLVWSLGGIATIRTRFDELTAAGVTRSTHPSYVVSVRIANAPELFTLKRLSEVANGFSAPTGLMISKIELVGQKAAQCIHIDSPEHLYVTDGYIVTHNTEALTSIATNALSWGSGFIYVDGKADSSLYAKIYAMCRKMGRDDDILVINLMTGSLDALSVNKIKMSNTMNPFSTGSADFLTQMIVSLMSESGGDNAMWKDRAISLVSGLMGALCFMRDYEGLLLNSSTIRDYLNFPKLYTLYARRDEFPESIAKAIQGYVRSLPGFQEKNRGQQGEDALKQHGFLEMQFTRIMGSLADTYGHIFMHELAEVDLEDVVLNRRILVVLLPSLEKSPDELRNLGNIVMAALRAMMAKTLGATIEGSYESVVEAKPTNSPSPYFVVLDEYGYYAVKGAAVMFAQARSLGFSMVVAGQDRQALDKASKEEAGSIIANCKVKISMALEDPTDTFDLFSKAAGDTYVSQVSGFSANTSGLMVSYNDMGNASLEKRTRLTLQELKDLNPGEAVVMIQSKIIRADMFFANIPKAKRGMRINRFLKVKPPTFESLSESSERIAHVIDSLTSGLVMAPHVADDLGVISDYYQHTPTSGFGVKERSIAAFMGYMEANRRMAEGFASSLMEEEPGQLGHDRGGALGGGADRRGLPDDVLDGGLVAALDQKRRTFVKDVLGVDSDKYLIGRKRPAAPTIPDGAHEASRQAIKEYDDIAGSETPVKAPMRPLVPPPPKPAPSIPKNKESSILDDVLSDFEGMFGMTTEPEQPAAEATASDETGTSADAETPNSADSGDALSVQVRPIEEAPVDAAEAEGAYKAAAEAGEEIAAKDSGGGKAIAALAQAAGFDDEQAMFETFEAIERGVGGAGEAAAKVQAEVAMQTLTEAVEEYPDKPLPPPASAESVLNLLEQLVENYEARGEPLDDDSKE
jgi:hypothetical protein